MTDDNNRGFSGAVNTSDGFTVKSDPRGGLNYFLHGERWPAPGKSDELVRLIESLAKEIERLRGDGQTSREPHEATYLRGWNEGIEHAMEIVGNMRQSGAGLFDAKHSGQRGCDRSDALYDAYVAIKALTVSSTNPAPRPPQD